MNGQEIVQRTLALRHAFQVNSRLQLEFTAQLSRLLREHSVLVDDEVLRNIIIAVPDELMGGSQPGSNGSPTTASASSTGPGPQPPATPGPGPQTLPGPGPQTTPGPGPQTLPGPGPQTLPGPGPQTPSGPGPQTPTGPGPQPAPAGPRSQAPSDGGV